MIQELIEADAVEMIGAAERRQWVEGRVLERVSTYEVVDQGPRFAGRDPGVPEGFVSVHSWAVNPVAAAGIDTGISRSEVSWTRACLDGLVGALGNRTLGHMMFPYVYRNATYVNVRDDALVQAVAVATVVTARSNG